MQTPFVYFDAGGVLFHFKSGLSELATKHGLHYSDFERVLKKHSEEAVKGYISPQELWHIYQDELGFKDESIHFLEYWVSHLSPIRESHALIKNLVANNVSIGLITNLYTGVFEKAIEYGHIPNVSYAATLNSCALHLMKPELAIYHLAQEQAATDPQNILFIDDKPSFLEPAKTLGWQTFLFDENNAVESVEKLRNIIAV